MRPVSKEIVARRISAMTNDIRDSAELGEAIFSFDVSDDVLERAAAVTDAQAVTIGSCTHWWHCSWPM